MVKKGQIRVVITMVKKGQIRVVITTGSPNWQYVY